MSKSTKGAIRKTIHTTTSEVPLKSSESRRKVLRHSIPPSNNNCTDNNIINKNYTLKSKYHVPELNTSIILHSKIKEMESMKSLTAKSSSQLTPRTQAIMSLEKTKKLNFPPDKPVYKNLIPININDSVLMISNDDDDYESCKSFKKKYIRKTNKDPIPELSDFLEPIKPLQHKVPLYDKQDSLRKPKNNDYPLIYKLCTEYHPAY